MQVVHSADDLAEDIVFVDVLEDAIADGGAKVGLHVFQLQVGVG